MENSGFDKPSADLGLVNTEIFCSSESLLLLPKENFAIDGDEIDSMSPNADEIEEAEHSRGFRRWFGNKGNICGGRTAFFFFT